MLHQVDRVSSGRQVLTFGTPDPERGVDSMRRDEVAQFAARCSVSVAGALDGASDDVPGDEGGG
jgi:hypothetical protein